MLSGEKEDKNENLQLKNSTKPKKLSGFEALSELKLQKRQYSDSSIDYDSLDEKAAKFRAPKHMSSRSLLDEARMSLSAMKNSFDDLEEKLHDDLDTLQELEKSTKEKAKTEKQTSIEAQAQGRPAEFWKPGMLVKSSKFKEKGKVLRSADSKGNIECLFGIMKVKISYHELTPVNENQNTQKYEPQGKSNLFNKVKQNTKTKKFQNVQDSEIPPTLQHSGNTINLRGNTVDESLDKLDIELDKMNRQQVDRVVIIHGHGTGKIKESVRKHLEESPYKLRFRSGRQGEGGDGVTIVAFDD